MKEGKGISQHHTYMTYRHTQRYGDSQRERGAETRWREANGWEVKWGHL